MKFIIFLTITLCFRELVAQKFGKCISPSKTSGTCMYLHTCPSLLAMYMKKPVNQQDRAFVAKSISQCGYRDKIPLVCCCDSESATAKPETTPENSKTDLLPSECGIDLKDRIYGGNVTEINEYPWMALLEYKKRNSIRREFHCGGSLINSRYVITASHCVNGVDVTKSWILKSVRLGEWDTTTENDCDDSYVNEILCSDPPLNIAIEEKIPHPDYVPSSSNQHNDIALLRLARSVQFTNYIKPICLPVSQELRAMNFVNFTLTVAGWGKTESETRSTIKLKVNIDGVSRSYCQYVYSSPRINRDIIDSQICAGGEHGIDSCRGDSGGPLMRENDEGYWTLVGVVSYGPTPCGIDKWPGVYTRISNYMPWIESTLRP